VPSDQALKEVTGPIGGPKARQLGAVGGCEELEDLGGQLCELCGDCGRQALGRWGTLVGESSMEELPTCRRGASGRGEGLQVGRGGREGRGCARR
jgi:hypothetical protein